MMKRVFICSGRSLFSSGIKTLLEAEPDLRVIGWESDVDAACQSIQALQPDVILIVAEDASSSPLSGRQCLLKAEGKTRIIELNVQDRRVYLYTGEQITIQEVEDLVRAIEEPAAAGFPKAP